MTAAVLFVDMVGSTSYFSPITPDAVIEVLRDLHALLSASVFAHNGTIDKFLGDGLMAVFGAPEPSAVDATNAARCAFDIQQSLERSNERCDRTGDVPQAFPFRPAHLPTQPGDFSARDGSQPLPTPHPPPLAPGDAR
jgi:adenylate cyclase